MKGLSLRGMLKTGVVVSTKSKNTAIVKMDYVSTVGKYKRYARESSSIPAHVPDGMSVSVGDKVRIAESRKISKTKSWVVVEILNGGSE